MKTCGRARDFSLMRLMLVWVPIMVLICLSVPSLLALDASPEPKGELIPCGQFSSVFLRPQDTQYAAPPPTRIAMMSARWSTLQASFAGYQKTGVPLVGWDGSRLVPSEYKDDSGLDYFIPRLASFFRIRLSEAADLFLASTVILGYSLGLIGLMLLLGSWWSRCWAIIEVLALAVLCLRLGDVYVVQSSIAMATIPWILHFSRKWGHGLGFPFFLAVGLALGVANFMRAQAGTMMLLFCLLVLVLYGRTPPKRRVLLLGALLAGNAASALYFRHAFAARDAYIQGHQSGYLPAPRQHPLWHSVYIGLGFVSNPYVPGGYCDQVGMDKVHSLSPNTTFLSPEYEQILDQQVHLLVKTHPSVVIVNLAAKLGILQLLAVLAANIGLFAAVWYRKPLSLDLAFWAAIAFGALPGLAVVPNPKYVLGALTVLVLYGLVSIDYALREGAMPRLKQILAGRGKTVCAA